MSDGDGEDDLVYEEDADREGSFVPVLVELFETSGDGDIE